MKVFKFSRFFSTTDTIKVLLQKQIVPQHKQKFMHLRKKHGNHVVSEVKVDDAVLGMRGLPTLYYDGSRLDENQGIVFRGHSVAEFCQIAQKVRSGEQPLPQVMFFLLLTGRFPTQHQIKQISIQWKRRDVIQPHEKQFILNLPMQMHPMTMLSLSILNLQNKSKFFQAYQKGVSKSQHWQYYYEDAMDLIAKLPHICAMIYRHKYHKSKLIQPNHHYDWTGNFAHMLGVQVQQFKQCLRGYLSIHADHQGGNVSAHTYHLVGSALSDPYLSFSAAICGLSGPLHGLASHQSLKWLTQLKTEHKGQKPNNTIIQQYVNKTLNQGRVIPGYGHSVMKKADPRLTHLLQFAHKHIKNDQLVTLAVHCFNNVPGILEKISKIKNPYPNVDAFSGILFHHYGIIQSDFYTPIFAISRSIGCLANGMWARVFGLPIQRPSSIDLNFIQKLK